MSEAILKAENVSKFYGYGFLGFKKFPAVDDVTIYLGDRSAIKALVGESGCGKTTLAKILLNVVKPDMGRVLFNGRDLQKLKGNEMREFIRTVQAVFQDPFDSFNPLRKVEEYLFKTAETTGLDRNVDSIDRYLRIVGLSYEEIHDKKPKELSGGQLQRLAIARALLARPRILIADEPVSMIDASLRINILNILKKIKNELGICMLYITHDIATAYYISDEVMVMFRGCIVESGGIDVIDDPLHPYTEQLISSLPDFRKGKEWLVKGLSITPTRDVGEFIIRGCKYYARCHVKMDRCYVLRPPLTEVVSGRYVACWRYIRV